MKTRRISTLAARAGALLVLLLMPAPLARGNPPPPLSHDAAIGPATSNALLQFTSQGHILGFRTGEFYISNAIYALRVEELDANPVTPASDTPSVSNERNRESPSREFPRDYASRSVRDNLRAPPLNRVTYANLWEGITLTYDAARGGIVSSSYRLEQGADPRAIHLRYNAPVALNPDGTLMIAYATGQMVESAPLAWQESAGVRVPVRVAFLLRGEREIGFSVGEYDAAQPLFIDPTLTWNTFLGGSLYDFGNAIAVDGSGNVYVAGASLATWGAPVRAYTSGYDVFAAKLSSSGALTWNTFLGASGDDEGFAIAVDASGNVYVAGSSNDTWGSPVRAFGGGFYDAFVAKLNSNGVLTWNTFLGGSGTDNGNAITLDGSGNVYVTGYSYAPWGLPVRAFGGGFYDAFVAKLDSSGSLTWNTFLGGSGNDAGIGIALDGSGNLYVAGHSTATWGSPVRSYTSGGTFGDDAFAAKLDSNGALLWNTFLGGSGDDVGYGMAVDGSGNVYVAGNYSTATWGSPVRAYTSGKDAFAAKLDSSGALLWNTFLGGSGTDYGDAIAVDGSGNVYVAGDSDVAWGSPFRAYTSSADVFAAKLDSSGALIWNTFLGGSAADNGTGGSGIIALDGSGNVYVAGSSCATWGSPVRAFSGFCDAFAVKIYGFSFYFPFIIK